MKAKKFIKVWKKLMEEIVKEGEALRGQWKQDAEWTRDVIGKSQASGEGSRLGDKLIDCLGKENWHYWAEEWKLDLVLAEKKNWSIPECKEVLGKKGNLTFWPTTYEIIVEHETSGGLSWQEMVKLIHLRSRLKVLITYTYDLPDPANETKRSQDLIETIRGQFKDMLKGAWKNFPENWDTEYLLVVGQLDERGNTPKVNWHCTVFAPWGEQLNTTLFSNPKE